MIDDELRLAVEAGTREGTRRRVLLDRGYRVRWWFGVAILVADVVLAPIAAFATVRALPGSDWFLEVLALVLIGNVVSRGIAPPLSAPPTTERLTAERVLTLSTRTYEPP